jgi:Tfp pilus assembly protein PilO
MAIQDAFNYKTESSRYNYYYRRFKVFYQKPITQVSSAVLFSLAAIIFFAVFAIRPTLITIGELLKKIETQKVILEKAEKKVASLATAQQLYNQISGDLYVIEDAIPAEYNIQQLLLAVEGTAANIGIPINNLNMSKIVYPIEDANAGITQEISFTINFEASYPDAKIFMQNLSLLPRLMSLDSIGLSQSEANKRNSGAAENSILINLNGRVFYYPEGAE